MAGKLQSNISYALLVLKESFRSFNKNKNFDVAASLAYYGFFAFIPLFFIVLSFLSLKSISPQILIESLERITGHVFPQFGKVITDELYILTKHRNAVGLFGFILLFWSIAPLINAARNAFSAIFGVNRKASFVKSLTVDVMALSIVILLFAALLVSELYYDTFSENALKMGSLTFDVIDYAIPFVATFLSISLFYTIFSPIRLRIIHLIIASLFVALFWTIMKEVFSNFVIMNPNYGFAFGSLRAISVVIVWSYFSFCIMLFGAEMMANMRNRDLILLKKLIFGRSLSTAMTRQVIDKFVRTYNESETIYSQGERANGMFYVLSGRVNIFKNDALPTTLGEGTYFGDLSMFLEEPRNDTATAVTDDTRLVVISRDNFLTIIKEHPMIVFSILKDMASRMKEKG